MTLQVTVDDLPQVIPFLEKIRQMAEEKDILKLIAIINRRNACMFVQNDPMFYQSKTLNIEPQN